MSRWPLLVLALIAINVSGCIDGEPPPAPPAAADPYKVTESVRLDLNGTGWARYEVVLPTGGRVEVALEAPDGIDLCDPFFSRTRDLPPEQFTSLAFFVGDDTQNTAWYLLHGQPWGWPTGYGDMECAQTEWTVTDGDRATVVVGTTMAGMTLEIRVREQPPIKPSVPARLEQHPGFAVTDAQPERSATLDLGMAAADRRERWTIETQGGPRLVLAEAWVMHRETALPRMAHAGLGSERFGLNGVDPPVEPADAGLPFPDFGSGSMTASAAAAGGYASGNEPVVALSERDTLATAATGERTAGLLLWELPLTPPGPQG